MSAEIFSVKDFFLIKRKEVDCTLFLPFFRFHCLTPMATSTSNLCRFFFFPFLCLSLFRSACLSVCKHQRERNREKSTFFLQHSYNFEKDIRKSIMYQPRVFCIKLQLHFGGDVHEIAVPAFDGAEPTVLDLMSVIERDFRVPRVLQHLVFHGQELHSRSSEPLSRFGIKNLATIRLVGRMAPAELIPQINAQYQTNNLMSGNSSSSQQLAKTVTSQTLEQSSSYAYEKFPTERMNTVGTQYDPPILTPERMASPNSDRGQVSERSNAEETKPPATPNGSN